jgi:hypothetical protein
VKRFSAESAVEDRTRARGGLLYRGKVSRTEQAEAHHVGRRWKRSRPKRIGRGHTLRFRGGDRDISGPGSVASPDWINTPVGAAEIWPKWAVAACRHRPPVRLGAPSARSRKPRGSVGCSSLICGLQTSARRISGSLVAWHGNVRVDGGSSSSGAEAALASCRGITTNERVRGALYLAWITGKGSFDPRTTLRGALGTTKDVPDREQQFS